MHVPNVLTNKASSVISTRVCSGAFGDHEIALLAFSIGIATMNVMKFDEVAIRTDADGLYRLNDLHKAAGGEARHRPSLWMENRQAIDLINKFSHLRKSVKTQKGGAKSGVYAAAPILAAYASWLGGSAAASVLRHIAIDHIESVSAPRPIRREFLFGDEIVKNLFSGYEIIAQFPVFGGKYRIDWYIPELRLAVEFDEIHHSLNEKQDAARQLEIEQALGCRFLRYSEEMEKAK